MWSLYIAVLMDAVFTSTRIVMRGGGCWQEVTQGFAERVTSARGYYARYLRSVFLCDFIRPPCLETFLPLA